MHHFDPPMHPWGHEFIWWPTLLLSTLSILFWIALFVGLAWILLRLILPDALPRIANFFGAPPADISPLEILRQRYAAGEIDAVTFEQMRERLEASYRQASDSMPPQRNRD